MFNDFNSMCPGGPGGVSISGKWINRKTGKKIIVRDNIISEQGMQIRCSDGNMISMNEFSRDYIQASDEMYDMSGNVIGKEAVDANDIMYDLSPVKHNVTQVSRTVDDSYTIEESEQETKNTNKNAKTIKTNELVKKLFEKVESKPTINLTITWADFPENEINTLVNFLDISTDEIADYIYNQYADADAIKKVINDYVMSKITGE